MSTERLLPRDIEKELKESFVAYAMTVIISRALPDVRDGLKPVHRRILYDMEEQGTTPDKPFRKSARIVGDVLGKYHPHGDSAVYDAMVRMAQPFVQRYMLVEGQGNFGNEDGDQAAAMRYTEVRLAKVAMEMLSDIRKDTVDFGPNFDETTTQPTVLPARFPNLLVNGSSGIAVGMATNVPPHNLGEVIDGVLCMIDNPECTVSDLMQYIKGPDFPTGASIMGMRGIQEAYHTGRGKIVMRAKSEIEAMTVNRSRIIINEIPYQVNKANLVSKIAELVNQKVIEGISDIRDESDREGMRIVIELKKDVNAQVILNYLYKHTQLQDTFGANMLALVNNQPRILNLREIIYYYLEHQKDVIVRRTRYDLNKAEARVHVLQGLLIALDNIDEVVRIIRSNRTTADAREQLMERFALSRVQADAILDMRLARLTGLEREKLEEEVAQLMATIEHLKAILGSEQMVLDIIREEIMEIRTRYADPRRTEILPMANEIDMEDLIQEEDMVVTLTHFGYIKRLPSATYRSQRRGGKGIIALQTREEDFVEHIFTTSTHTELMFFTNRGRVYRLKCYEIPEAGRQAKGNAIVNLLQLEGGEKVTTVISLEGATDDNYLVMATRMGMIKKTPLSDFANLRSRGLIAIVLRDGDELVNVQMTDGTKEVILATHDGMSIRFHEDELRVLGRATQGVKSMDLNDGDTVVSMSMIVGDHMQVLTLSENGYGRRTSIEEYRVQGRNGKGIKAMRLTEKTGALVGLLLVDEDEDIMIISEDGTIIRMSVSDVSFLSRNTQGVKLMRLSQGIKVVCMARVEKAEDEEDESSDLDMTDEGLDDNQSALQEENALVIETDGEVTAAEDTDQAEDGHASPADTLSSDGQEDE